MGLWRKKIEQSSKKKMSVDLSYPRVFRQSVSAPTFQKKNYEGEWGKLIF